MLKYADICWRMVAYSGVWVQVDKGAKALVVLWRMLTYGGVWWRMGAGGRGWGGREARAWAVHLQVIDALQAVLRR